MDTCYSDDNPHLSDRFGFLHIDLKLRRPSLALFYMVSTEVSRKKWTPH